MNQQTTDDECIDALRVAAEELGKSPTKAEYETLGLRPASGTIIRVMGGWNAAKEAAGLETYLSHGSRTGSRPDGVELSDDAEWEDLTVDQRWYYRNRDEETAQKLQRRNELRAWVYDYKRQRACARCGESDPACLEFHHTSAHEKRLAIGQMVTYGYAKTSIRAEMSKCELVCANCHRRAHINPPVGGTGAAIRRIRTDVRGHRVAPDESRLTKVQYLRAWTAIYKQISGCRRCSVDDPSCLVFHHDDPSSKTAGVGEMISYSYPAAAVLAEVERCTVLCANCHRKEHYVAPEAVEME